MALRRIFTLATAMTLVVASLTLSGCGLLGTKYQTVSDQEARFHFEVPSKWSSRTQAGLITVYGDEELPTDTKQAIGETPWIFVYSSSTTETTALSKQVTALAEERGKARGWTKTKFGKPKKGTMGGAEAAVMDIAATDESGRSFEGVLALSQSEGSSVLVFAFAKPGSFDRAIYDDFAEHFYWHSSSAQDASTEETASK